MSEIIGKFGGDASNQRAENFAAQMTRKHPEWVYLIEDAPISWGTYPRFPNGVAIDHVVVKY